MEIFGCPHPTCSQIQATLQPKLPEGPAHHSGCEGSVQASVLHKEPLFAYLQLSCGEWLIPGCRKRNGQGESKCQDTPETAIATDSTEACAHKDSVCAIRKGRREGGGKGERK